LIVEFVTPVAFPVIMIVQFGNAETPPLGTEMAKLSVVPERIPETSPLTVRQRSFPAEPMANAANSRQRLDVHRQQVALLLGGHLRAVGIRDFLMNAFIVRPGKDTRLDTRVCT
jgi:hypothetical protein